MISKAFVLAGTTFTVEVPADYQDKYKTKPSYTFSVKKAPAGPFYMVSLLEGVKPTEIGTLWPEKGNIVLAKKSQFKEYSMPVIIIKHAILAVWEGRNTDIKGWKVHYTAAPTPIMDVVYGSPVVTSSDLIREGGYEQDVYGDPHEQWEDEVKAENEAEARWS